MKIFIISALLLFNCVLLAQNKALNFNQLNNNYIVTPNNSAINVTNNFTLEFWLQPSKTETWAVILQEGKCSNSSTSYNVSIQSDSTISFGFNCSGSCNYTNQYKSTTKIYPGVCIHIAISYSSAGVKIYYNGILQPGQYVTGSYCSALKNSTEPLLIGVYRYLNETLGAYYDGLLDELRIWGRVLTPAEILANYQEPLIGNETDLRLYYKFDEAILGNGNTVINYATATGTAINGQTYSSNSSTPVTSNSCFLYTGLDESLTNNNNITVFPNPSQGKFSINNNGNIHTVEVYNIIGDKIYVNSICKQSTRIDIDLSNFSNGIYFLRIFSNEIVSIKKLIKK